MIYSRRYDLRKGKVAKDEVKPTPKTPETQKKVATPPKVKPTPKDKK